MPHNTTPPLSIELPYDSGGPEGSQPAVVLNCAGCGESTVLGWWTAQEEPHDLRRVLAALQKFHDGHASCSPQP